MEEYIPHHLRRETREDRIPKATDGWDETREQIDGFRTLPQSFYPSRYPADYDYPVRYEGPTQQSIQEMESGLSAPETIKLFQNAVENARQGMQQSLTGTERVPENLKPKLTVNLSGQYVERIPDAVVDVLKGDVQVLQLSHNQMWHLPYKLAECAPLLYLNLRDNRFKEFPKAIYKLPNLEILDLSRNKLSKIPEEIGNMKALRVLSLMNNNIENVPNCLGDLDALRILKLTGNPLISTLMQVVNGSNVTGSSLATSTDNEKETLLTKGIKKYLKTEAEHEAASKDLGEGSSSDGPVDTPRGPRRNVSMRFPIRVSYSGSESAPDTRSPGFQTPPIPTRSHYRVVSNQNDVLHNAALRRPSIAPLSVGNERNRSNSESVLQATQNNRTKRMGMVTKKNNDLSAVDEKGLNRNSHHFRGQSHGSALRDKHTNGLRKGSSSSSPRDGQRGMFVRRLSSLPEYKRESRSPDSIIEGAKGVLYSLHQVHPHVSTLLNVIKDGVSKRSSLERVYYAATTHLDHLDQELHSIDGETNWSDGEKAQSNRSVSIACSSCLKAYHHVGNLLLRNVSQLVADGDQRYIRTLILLVYGGLIEARNACFSLGLTLGSARSEKDKNLRISTIEEEHSKPRDRSVTPTRDRPNPERRFRNGALVQHSSNHSHINSVSSTKNTVPLYLPGRSRSNSRTNTLGGSASSSVANTPRSGEAFMASGNPMIRSRSNSAAATGHPNIPQPPGGSDQEIFEKIFLSLTKAVEHGQRIITATQPHWVRCLEVAHISYAGQKIVGLWSSIIQSSHVCLEMCDILRMRLSTIKLNEPDVHTTQDFWRICVRFTDSITNFLNVVREGKRMELIDLAMIQLLRPILKASRNAYMNIQESPWASLATDIDTPASTNGNSYHRARGSSGSSSSPYMNSVPPTPLSAALGPAAQATIPSTPASASLDRSFQGGWVQRADTLMEMQNTMVYRR